ncbi:glycosyltransferase family 2 protein [Parafrigoribacterium soli]|uniref:glycosyltransferase family 2 protein n=1 Tax=Parafrigoribacterium soli TaxID=3144663 RepID=UPI0032EDADD4
MPEIIQLHQRALPRVSIVIPAKNEARNLEIILSELPPVHQVILVDGNSTDDTVATARRVMPDIEVIQQTRTGKGNALACGFAAVTGDIFVMFDADGSADPAEIPAFVDALLAGADVAKGSRFCVGGGSEDITLFRRLGNYGLNLLTNVLLKTRYTDLCYGYNAFWTSVIPYLDLPDVSLPKLEDGRMHWGDGFEIETVLTCRVKAANLTVTEVPSVEKLRIFGVSNLNAISDGFRVLRTILHERPRVLTSRSAVSARPAHSLRNSSKSTDLSLKSA